MLDLGSGAPQTSAEISLTKDGSHDHEIGGIDQVVVTVPMSGPDSVTVSGVRNVVIVQGTPGKINVGGIDNKLLVIDELEVGGAPKLERQIWQLLGR